MSTRLIKNACRLSLLLWLVGGCASKMALIQPDAVEKDNEVEVVLKSKERIRGTVVRNDPVRLVVSPDGSRSVPIDKTTILEVRRRPPVYDSFGKPISEREIQRRLGRRHTLSYGIGGGLLSVGGSFFIGSLLVNRLNGNNFLLPLSLGIGGGGGTFLFLRAGKLKDREEAIERIRISRQRAIEIEKKEKMPEPDRSLEERIREEKEREEELRRERERLLRELEAIKPVNP